MFINSLVLRSEIEISSYNELWVLGTNYIDIINKTFQFTNYFLSIQSDQLTKKKL